jgi:hypothetical protein
MAERRPLVAGLKPAAEVNPAREQQFVYGDKDDPGKQPKRSAEARESKSQNTIGLVPFTTRVRADFAAALKRASLERQLAGEVPNTLQDILEEALSPWLRDHGYVK